MSRNKSNRLRKTALSFHGLRGRPDINQSIMFYLLEIVQPQKPDSEHTLDFLWVSTFVCSRNKHSCLLSITECPQGHCLWFGLTCCQSFHLATWRFNWIFGVIIKTGGVEKDTQYNLSLFSLHSVICSLIFDRIQDGHSTFLHFCPYVLKVKQCSAMSYGVL